MMNFISRVVGAHRLLLLPFYSHLQRYVASQQREVTHILAYMVQACHDLVPPDEVRVRHAIIGVSACVCVRVRVCVHCMRACVPFCVCLFVCVKCVTIYPSHVFPFSVCVNVWCVSVGRFLV